MSRMFGTVVRGVRAPIFREGDDVVKGTVETVLVKEGDEVKVNQPLMIVEAMKMETTFVSKVNGKVDKLYVAPGDRVNTEDLLVSFILDEEE